MRPPAEELQHNTLQDRSSPVAPPTISGDGRPARTEAPAPRHDRAGAWRPWPVWLAILTVVVLVAVAWRWQTQRPQDVFLIHPTVTTITETIASSGRVHGVTETVVGAQTSGIIERLVVVEGDQLTAGQPIAVLKHDVAEARVAQAEQAIKTARAQLAQLERGPLSSEVDAAVEQVRQAQAQLAQQRAALQQAQQSVAQADAQWYQLQAELDFAAIQLERSETLLERNYIARVELDQARMQFRVAERRVAAAQQAVISAQANVQALEAAVQAAQANVRALEARLRTVQTGATPEEIDVAMHRVEDAEHALLVARQQMAEAIVTAPFAGTVTAITTEPGQAVGTQGVVQLVSTALEIRLDVDESNLADLAVAQEAVISSSAFPADTFHGRVAEVGAAVDPARGTVTVKVAPLQPPPWLRPGQTVNVNIITQQTVPRMLIPQSAISRSGDQTVVFVVENGRALQKAVITRPPTSRGIPVLVGLSAEDRIIANAQTISAGERVRVKE